METGKSFKEQLAPLKLAQREQRAHVQPISQLMLRLKPGPNGDRFHETVRDILRWMDNRAGQKLPKEAWSMSSFEMSDVGAQRTAAVSLKEPLYWAARLDDADKDVARRTWVTEIGVGLDDNLDVIFGTRLVCTARGENPPFSPSLPGFVRSILAAGPCELDGQIVNGNPREVDTAFDVDWLVQLLENPSRTGDVIVIAQQESDGGQPKCLVNQNRMAAKLHGVAHVVVLTSQASFHLTDAIGKDLSVFRQAVRTYRPGFRAWLDEPARHPVAMPARIHAWPNGGASAFEADVCARAITNSAYISDREERLPSFTTIRQIASKIEREKAKSSGATDSELLVLYQDDNRMLRAEIDEQKQEYDQILAEADRLREVESQRANQAAAQALLARDHVRRLLKQMSEVSGQVEEPVIPSSLAELESWYKEHLAGSVIVASRAFQGAKKSVYHDPPLVYRALLALRDQYVPMRIGGGADLLEAYNSKLAELHLEDSATGDGAKFEGDEYYVQYEGTRRLLERHLKGGTSREARYCFRLYFFWDDASQVVVVGWLPSHLENRNS